MGDEGRDALIVRNLLTKGDLIFIGPMTSIGNMYLGPAYYYMMAPFLAMWKFSPVGPAVMVALISVVAIALTYYLGKYFFSPIVGLVAALLFSISPTSIVYSRSSWNPNPMPFFAILVILTLYKFFKTNNNRWLILTGLAFGLSLQMHYLSILLLPVISIFWLLRLRKSYIDKAVGNFLVNSFFTILVFIVLMLPLIIFDLNPQHKFLNFNNFKNFFLERAGTAEHLPTINLNPFNSFHRIIPLYFSFLKRFVTAGNQQLAYFLGVFIPVIQFANFKFLFGNKMVESSFLILWYIIGILGLSIYQLEVYDHYFGFMVPAAFLATALSLWLLFRLNNFAKVASGIILVILLVVNIYNSPLKFPPSNQLEKTQNRVDFIISQTNNKPFNFALIAQNNYDTAYQYYFELRSVKPVVIDEQHLEETITDQLFVICEDLTCQPLGYPKWEVAGFGKYKGLAVVENEWYVEGVKIFKLVHSEQYSI
ncbi:MAG: glycosyltransferase family 39 protein [Candidatus Aenigmatarchaeota archaeon]